MLIRSLIGLWCLATVVIGNAYTGTLTSFLTAPKFKPIINSLEELAASDHYKLTAELNAAPTETFLVTPHLQKSNPTKKTNQACNYHF